MGLVDQSIDQIKSVINSNDSMYLQLIRPGRHLEFCNFWKFSKGTPYHMWKSLCQSKSIIDSSSTCS